MDENQERLEFALKNAFESLENAKTQEERRAINEEIKLLYELKMEQENHNRNQEQKALENDREERKMASEKKSRTVKTVIETAVGVIGGAVSVGEFLLLLDWESDNSMRSKAWPAVSKKLGLEKFRFK